MLRILIAVAALYAFAGYTGHAKADESDCVVMTKFMAMKPAHFPAETILKPDEIERAVTFYNSMPGDELGFKPDSVIFINFPSGEVRIVFGHDGMACATFAVLRSKAAEVVMFIRGNPA